MNQQIKEIYSIVPDETGWRKMPFGNWVKLGDGVTLGDGVKLGDGVTLGNGVTLGDGVTLGNWVKLGDGVTLGNGVTLGDEVTLGNGVRLDSSPLQIQGSRHLATNGNPGKIQIGCLEFTFDYWSKHCKEIGEKEGYTPKQIDEYGKIIAFIIANGR